MKKNWGRTSRAWGVIKTRYVLSDWRNYTKFMLKISLFLKATAPTGGSLSL